MNNHLNINPVRACSNRVSAPRFFKGQRVGIVSLGCARNTVDSEKILIDAKLQGARITPIERASRVLVNTCAFTQEAKEESIGVILDLIKLKERGKIREIVVHGCLSQRYPKELQDNFREVDSFVGVADFKRSFDSDARITPPHYAYLKICEGCANLCSFCAVPNIKGPFKSREESLILREAEFLEFSGVKELNIIGQDITMFGQRPCSAPAAAPLVKLLKKILKRTSFPWIRLLYLNPLRISDDLIELLASEKRMCPYVDMPLQHINNRILKLMNRRISKEEIIKLIEKLRSSVEDVVLRTTFIVGFPSETHKEFQELLDFIRQVRFDRLGALIYSREEGTRAYHFKGQVSRQSKLRRYHRLMSEQKKISEEVQKREVGKVLEVIVEEETQGKRGLYTARTRKDAPEADGLVFLKSKSKLKPGAILECKIVDSYVYDLMGEVVT